MIQHMIDNLDIFVCPACGAELEVAGAKIECVKRRHSYNIRDNIPLMFQPNERNGSKNDGTDSVKAFYQETPFPNYEESEGIGDLIQKSQKGIYACLLNDQVPYNIRVLEVGCGTGQLGNFLSTSQRYVFATDMCLNSLKLGQAFKESNGLERIGFYQMNSYSGFQHCPMRHCRFKYFTE